MNKSTPDIQLTVLIPFMNEGEGMVATVADVRRTVGNQVDVVVLNDCSTDGYPYEEELKPYDVTYVCNPQNLGSAPSGDVCVGLCKTPFLPHKPHRPMNKYIIHMAKFFLFCTMLLCSFSILAEDKNDKRIIYGLVKDQITQEILSDVDISIYMDTTLVAEAKTSINHGVNDVKGYWFAQVPPQGGLYRFCFLKDGYEYYEKTVEMKPFKKMESSRFAFNTNLKRKPKEHKLNDVVVKATQIKFYHKGDTVVYNADAFNLAEGSMLDNLVKSIPGAELNDDGEIKVNGRKVDALLLNGEDFFKGKNHVMLENLPAYMVKTIKVYDRKDPMALATGKNMRGDYVMDVNLKKQYSIGNIGNVEVGMGSENRYLARLFALRFTDASRIGVYANINNLNDKRKPGESSNWTPEKMPHGLLSQKMGGIDYLIKPKHTLNKFSGNAELSYTDADNYSETTTETFLTEGNTYAKSRRQDRSDNFSFRTSHEWKFMGENGVSGLTVTPSFGYSRFNQRANILSATFDANPYDYVSSRALLDSIRHGNSQTLRQIMLNRYNRDHKVKGHNTASGLQLDYSKFRSVLPYALHGTISYTSEMTDRFNRYGINYPNSSAKPSTYLNTYSHNTPFHTLKYEISPAMWQIFPHDLNLSGTVVVGQVNKKDNFARYNLNQLADWGENNNHPLGELPSEVDFKRQTFDVLNSYNLHEMDNYAGFKLFFNQNGYGPSHKDSQKYRTNTFVNIPIYYHHYRLNYTRGDGQPYQGITRRNTVLMSPWVYFEYIRKDMYTYRFEYNMKQSAPSMTSLLTFIDTSDPLNIRTGNKDLKNTTTHDVSLLYARNNYEKQCNFTIKQSYFASVNTLAYTYTFDRSTGVRNYRPMNINGNYRLTTDIWHWCTLDKKRRLTINDQTHLTMNHGVDYISEDPDVAPQRSTVNVWSGNEKVELKYKLGKHSIGATGSLVVNRVTSTRKDFSSYTLWDFNYGVTAVLKLPLAIELSTDLTMYSHRGYNTSSSNTNDLVWNARLSKTFTKAGITLALDGFDILGNLSNISQYVNSQGRTETYYNSLPRYVMAHVIYRFNKQPKKR